MAGYNRKLNENQNVVYDGDYREGLKFVFYFFLIVGAIGLLSNILVAIARYDKLHGIYRYTAFFYNCIFIQPFVGFGIALDWLTVHSPLPWANLNLVLALVLLFAPLIGLFIFLKRKRLLKYVIGVLCLPAVVMVIYYLGSILINWLFAK